METRATRRPGQKGTRKHLEQYGDRLLFVRYRYDPKTNTRLTTIELIVDERPVRSPVAKTPPAQAEALKGAAASVPLHPTSTGLAGSTEAGLAGLRIAAREQALRAKVRSAGGYWEPRLGLWVLRADRARALGLASRLVELGPDDGAIQVATGATRYHP